MGKTNPHSTNIDTTPKWSVYIFTVFSFNRTPTSRGLLQGTAPEPMISGERSYSYDAYHLGEHDSAGNKISWFATQFQELSLHGLAIAGRM